MASKKGHEEVKIPAYTETELNQMPYELLNPKSYINQDYRFKVIIIGNSGVGKSCILTRMTTNEFTEDHEVTVGVEFGSLIVKLDSTVFKMQIWDTAGQESFKSITKIFYRGAHCVFLTYDISKLESFQALEGWFKEIKSQCDPDVLVFLIGNMSDKASEREVSRDKALQFKEEKGIKFFIETSARKGENIEELFIMASKYLYSYYKHKLGSLVSPFLLIIEIKQEKRQRIKSECTF